MPGLEAKRTSQGDSPLKAVGEVDAFLGVSQAIGNPLNSSATGAAGAISATLTGEALKYTYLTAFEVTGGGATAASVILVTVTGLQGGTQNFYVAIPAGATVGINPLLVRFPTPLRSSGLNTNIVVNVPSFGAGNAQAAVAAHGYTL